MYTFTDDMLIGNQQIDDEHRHLFDLLNDVHEGAESGKSSKELALSLGSALAEYAGTHFAHEEAYMESINDGELPLQRQEHAAFAEKIRDFLKEDLTDGNAGEKLNGLYTYAATWLYHHIIGSDTLIGTDTLEEVNADADFEFTDKYLTGIDFVDEQHRRLFEIISDLHIAAGALRKGYDQYDEIVGIIDDLTEYTINHFSDEEKYMASISYEGLPAQQRAHRAFVNKIQGIDLTQMDEQQNQYLADLIRYLLNWLSGHILKVDKKIPKKD